MQISGKRQNSAGTQFGSGQLLQRWLAPLVLLFAVTILNLATLVRSPAPFVDDAWYANRAWALIHTGRPFGTLDAGVFDGYDGYWTFIPYFGAWILSLAIRLLGLSLYSVRVVSLIFGLTLLVALYVVGNQVGGLRTGLLAVSLTALSPAFLYSAHIARPDIMVAALGFAAVGLHVTDRGERLTVKSILSGLAIALAFELHPNGIIYAPTLAVLHLFDRGRRLLRTGRFWGFTAGVAVGLLIYASIHILPYPQTYLALTRSIYAPWRTPPILSLHPAGWLRSLGDTLVLLARANPWRAPLVVAAALSLLVKAPASERRLLGLFAAVVLAFAALVRHKLHYFAIELAPAADLVVVSFLAKLFGGSRVATQKAGPVAGLAFGLQAALILALLLAATATSLLPLFDNPMADYEAAVQRIGQAVPAEISLMGSQTYWIGFPERRYYSWENLKYYQHSVAGSTLTDAFDALRPDYLLIDAHLECFITDDGAEMSEYDRFLRLPKPELEAFLDRQAHLVTAFDTRSFGTVRIYQLDWN